MGAYQGVNLLFFMIKIWTDLNTALFSSSFRLTEAKISRFSEISQWHCSFDSVFYKFHNNIVLLTEIYRIDSQQNNAIVKFIE
jgi:hypothetical protein